MAAEIKNTTTQPEAAVSETPVSEPTQLQGGPRIVINPTTFRNQKDALCVAFNEGFRLWMEANDFQPQSEPTDEQRKFFSDTAYADDELQLRRTILARIATFDTSVKDPTDDQISETAQFLGAILESDWCKNEWERDCVSRLANAANAAVGAEPTRPKREPLRARETEPLQAKADMGGGTSGQEEEKKPLPAGKDEAGEKVDVPVNENPENADMPADETPEQTDMPVTDGNPVPVGEPMPPAQNAPEPAEPASRPGAIDRPIVEPGSRGSISRSIVEPGSRGSISRSIVEPGSRGSISRSIVEPGSRGSISRSIVEPGSRGSISRSIVEPGSRGSISRSIVEPGSRGSIANRSNAARPLYQPLVPGDEDQEDGLL